MVKLTLTERPLDIKQVLYLIEYVTAWCFFFLFFQQNCFVKHDLELTDKIVQILKCDGKKYLFIIFFFLSVGPVVLFSNETKVILRAIIIVIWFFSKRKSKHF